MMDLYIPVPPAITWTLFFQPLSSPDNPSPAIMRHLTPTLVFFPNFYLTATSILPSLLPSPVLISLSLSLPHQLTGNCSFSSHNVSDSQFMPWQDSSIFWKFEVCGSVSSSSAMHSQSDGSTAPDWLWFPLNPSTQIFPGRGRAGPRNGPLPVGCRLLPRHNGKDALFNVLQMWQNPPLIHLWPSIYQD